MPVYLPTAVVGNNHTLINLGHAGEIMAWFYPSKDHAQHIYQCLPCVYVGAPGQGQLSWTWGDEWQREQEYSGDTNICATTLTSHSLGIELCVTDVVPEDNTVLLRHISARSLAEHHLIAGIFHYGDWNMGGIRTGNALRYAHKHEVLIQSHREAAVVIGGDALESWQCGKAGEGWGSNAQRDLEDGALNHQDLEIGDVNWAFGFNLDLRPGATMERIAIFSLAGGENNALEQWQAVNFVPFEQHCAARREVDAQWLSPGLETLRQSGAADSLSAELTAAYKRSLLCLPLLDGQEGVAVAAPEFDPEFVSCGGYGYFWPRDGGEYLSGLLDAGYSQFTQPYFDWCARHQDASGLWHQRYFLNGEPGPNWCLPPDMLQIDQVGAVLWALGKARSTPGALANVEAYQPMVRRAADYLLSRLTERGVHGNAFDTWETFIGSFTYSNASIYAALMVAGEVLEAPEYSEGAARVKRGVLEHFVRNDTGYPYLVRGFNAGGELDNNVDSSSLGAVEPFGLLDLNVEEDLRLAEGTLRAISERLEIDWEGGRAIRRFEGDAYVGGVPACVNTLWTARCCLKIASHLRDSDDADAKARAEDYTRRAQLYLSTVLRRATPTGLLPELMQGPEGQRYWAAPHGWAMASFVSGVLGLAQQLK